MNPISQGVYDSQVWEPLIYTYIIDKNKTCFSWSMMLMCA